MSNNHYPVKKSSRLNISEELSELLNRLDLSPSVLLEEDALAIDRNSSCSSSPRSVQNADTDYGYPDQVSTANTIDREALLEQFALVKAKGEIYAARNNFYHDQLVEHFKRKQMMRVYGEPNEADPLMHRYLKKLSKYEELRQELQAGEEDLQEELKPLKEDLRIKSEEADAALEDLVSEERAAGAQAFANGKPMPAKEIEALITRELGKMKDISKIRVRYARLRDSLVEKEIVFDALNIITPNLNQKDYERLEAENFYYKHELRMKEQEAESLARRRACISRELKSIRDKRNNLSRVTQKRRKTLGGLKLRIAEVSRRRDKRRRKIKEVKEYFDKFESILGLSLYPEVQAKMKDVKDRHKEWLDKIATLVAEIKLKDRYLKALGTCKSPRELPQTTDDEDSDENFTSFHKKSRRPPLGGGFLQAL